jgi:hypothetical protein
MKKLGFDIDEYREAAQRRQDITKDNEFKYEANRIAAADAKTNRQSLWTARAAVVISVIALVFSVINQG